MFESIVAAILLVVIGAIPVVPAIADGGVWGAEASAGLVMMGLGVLVLVDELRLRARTPTRGPGPSSSRR